MSDLPQTTGLQQTTDQLPDTVALEREKIALERDKLGVEKIKAKWTAISVVVTLVAAILTIAFGLWTNHQQAKIQFETKVVEILMQSTLPAQAKGRIDALSRLFPDRLPKDVAKSFNPEDFTAHYEPDTSGAKKDFLKLLADKGLTKEEIVKVYKHLFRGEGWIDGFSLESVLSGNESRPNKSVEKDAPG
jgi:hypothetical protein